jgi:hypothetical protein
MDNAISSNCRTARFAQRAVLLSGLVLSCSCLEASRAVDVQTAANFHAVRGTLGLTLFFFAAADGMIQQLATWFASQGVARF